MTHFFVAEDKAVDVEASEEDDGENQDRVDDSSHRHQISRESVEPKTCVEVHVLIDETGLESTEGDCRHVSPKDDQTNSAVIPFRNLFSDKPCFVIENVTRGVIGHQARL